MSNNNANGSSIIPHLPWIVPLVMAILGLGFEVFSIVGKVKALEERSYVKGEMAIRELEALKFRVDAMEEIFKDKHLEHRVTDLEYRLDSTERWCCSETDDQK